ncbi:hypothetical protein E4U19_001180 [Claviceps sp. Clav32 group G5]|nr:hypothetical protein E4U19_001180 [Claviceps sp. Clav32 group G5]KAG6043940.1 hypothetical protein E4U39_003940 [Claviceps sp. Clav50 group G5]
MPSSPPPATSAPASPLLPAVTPPSLADRLCSVLPKDHSFGIYHLSTPPQKTEALVSPPPNERPDRTYCEKHFFVLSICLPSKEQQQQPVPEDVNTTPAAETQQASASPKREILVLGLEIFLYTTAHSTTLFVSKADSTGYLPLLGLPRHGSASPVRDVCAAFIEHLVEHRRRAGIQFVISLFARSQGQYLFPGSVDHGGKHILDDRGLIKWWCRVLDPLIKSPPSPPLSGKDAAPTEKQNRQGYLLVPGLDAYETRVFIPRRGPSSSPSTSWTVAHPLERISRYYREFDWVPPRCLIPRFPDDPKCRFRDELDEETGSGALRRTTGNWKNIKTLDMFWEMMAYRQECSSGRMTGFIWVVLEDEALETAAAAVTPSNNGLPSPSNTSPLPSSADLVPQTRRLKSIAKAIAKARANPKLKMKRFKKLKGGVIRRQPTAKTQQRNRDIDIPTKTRHYYWPPAGRGSRIINERAYKRITELMLHSDFSTLDKAVSSTERWIKEGGLGNGDWGCLVTGQREERRERDGASCSDAAEVVKVNDVGGLVKRKRARVSPDRESVKESKEEGHVNVLGAGLVRKKVKTNPDTVVGEGGA